MQNNIPSIDTKHCTLSNEILWQEEQKLKWTDFEGKPEFFSDYSAVSATYVQITHGCSEAGKFAYHVKTAFVKDQSWTRDKHSKDLLEHEQVHFDLTEYYARVMRFQVEQLKDPCGMPLEELKAVTGQVYRELELAHMLYDMQTKHGLDEKNQEVWNEFVATGLEELMDFKNNPVYE